jgi:hypothetical protein
MVSENIFPRPGERVLVPWGLEEVLGEVIEVYSTGLGDKAVVRVLGESDADTTVTVPADILIPAAGRARGVSPRIDEMTFRDEVTGALREATDELHVALFDQELPDRGIDAVIIAGRGQVAIQIKYFAINRLPSDSIAAIAGYARSSRPVIVIANAGLTRDASSRLERINHSRQIVWFIRWTGHEDYSRLLRAINQAVGLVS